MGRHEATFTTGFVYRIPEAHEVRQRLDETDVFEFGIGNAESGIE